MGGENSTTTTGDYGKTTDRRAIVRIRARSDRPRTIHPIALVRNARGWAVIDQADPERPIALVDWGDINVSARSF